jgi:GT2 family glycosyltransferase
MHLGIFIVTWNRFELLKQTLASLRDCIDLPAEVTVIDNASEEPVLEWLDQQYWLRVYPLAHNLGLNGAHERAWPENLTDKYDLVLVADNDVEFRRPLSEVCEFMRANPIVNMVALQHAPEHPVLGTVEWRGRKLPLKRVERGQSLLCRAEWLQSLRPLPVHKTFDFDWWLCRDAPESIGQRGEYLVCFPGHTRHLGPAREQSTWGNSSPPEIEVFP